jgi:hypothetical protein
VPSSFLSQGRIGPQQTNRFCSRLIIGGFFFGLPHPALNSRICFGQEWTGI